MKKGLVLLAIMLCAAPGMAATLTLPPVTLDGCNLWLTIEPEAQMLIQTIAGFGVEGIPSYDEADLENGMAGDGIPDKYQMALLAALLCKGNATVQAQFDTNMNHYTTLVNDLVAVFGILLGNPTANPPVPSAADRLTQVATILTPYVPDLVPQAVIDALNSAATELGDFVADLPPEINGAVLPVLANTLRGFKEAVAALMGLDTEIQASVLNLLTSEILSDVTAIRQQVLDIATQMALLTGEESPLSPDDKAYINALIADVDIIVAALDRTIALTTPGAIPIYGVTSGKAAHEPFSGVGDYDKNGVTNLEIYNILKAAKADVAIEDFVDAASNPLSPLNPYLPVGGLVGLAALAGACLTGGAFALRRK